MKASRRVQEWTARALAILVGLSSSFGIAHYAVASTWQSPWPSYELSDHQGNSGYHQLTTEYYIVGSAVSFRTFTEYVNVPSSTSGAAYQCWWVEAWAQGRVNHTESLAVNGWQATYSNTPQWRSWDLVFIGTTMPALLNGGVSGGHYTATTGYDCSTLQGNAVLQEAYMNYSGSVCYESEEYPLRAWNCY
jgi:hypothetical protein